MKQIDHASVASGSGEDNVLRKLQTGLQDALRLGSGDVHHQAQDVLAGQLGRMLDNRYILLRNITLSPGSQPIPMILFGATGLWVINVYGADGVFRAEGEQWLVLNQRTQQLQPASHNLIQQTLDFTRDVADFISTVGDDYPAPQPVLFFGHPGAHIDAAQPAVRIVRMDGVDRLYGLLISGRPILDNPQIQKAVEALVKASTESRAQKVEVKPVETKDEFWQEEGQPAAKPTFSDSIAGIDLPPALKKLRLTNQQWIILAVMAGFDVIILIAFIIFILILL